MKKLICFTMFAVSFLMFVGLASADQTNCGPALLPEFIPPNQAIFYDSTVRAEGGDPMGGNFTWRGDDSGPEWAINDNVKRGEYKGKKGIIITGVHETGRFNLLQNGKWLKIENPRAFPQYKRCPNIYSSSKLTTSNGYDYLGTGPAHSFETFTDVKK